MKTAAYKLSYAEQNEVLGMFIKYKALNATARATLAIWKRQGLQE